MTNTIQLENFHFTSEGIDPLTIAFPESVLMLMSIELDM